MGQSEKVSMLKDTWVFAAATNIVQILGIVNSIALRRFMGPATMGIWSFLQVILGYCGYASFGTTKAMARDYPYLRGKGEHGKAEELKDITFTFTMTMSLIPAFLISSYLLVRWNGLEVPLRLGLVFMVGFLFVQRFYDLIINLLRSDKKFVILSQVNVMNAVAGLAVTLLLVSLWNIYGLMLGTALVMFGCLFFIYRAHSYQFKYFWSREALWRELKLGIPLVATTFLTTFLNSMDKLIIAKQLGFYEVGLYSIAMMVNSYLFSLPMMFSNVWFPYLQQEYGRRGSAEGIKNYLLKPIAILSVLVPFLCGLAVLCVPVAAHFLLPKFMPGIPAMKIYLVGGFFFLIGGFGNRFRVTLDKYWVNLPILSLSIALNFALNLSFVKAGWGLMGIATGTAVSFIFYGLTSYIVALQSFMSSKEIAWNVLKLVLVLSSFFGTIFLLDHWTPSERLIVSSAIKSVLFVLFSLPFFWRLEKRLGYLEILRGAWQAKRVKEEAVEEEETGESRLEL